MKTLPSPPFLHEGARALRPQFSAHSAIASPEATNLIGNITLRDIFKLENISKSTAYKLGLVPLYDQRGLLTNERTTPPFPWLRLPTPVIKTGKKLWAAQDVMVWHYRIRSRALQMNDGTGNIKSTGREVIS